MATVLISALTLVRKASGSPPPDCAGAWYVLRANQAWAPFPDNDPTPPITDGVVLCAGEAGRRLRADPARAAELEVNWWHVHRQHRHDPAVSGDDLVAALVDLYANTYDAEPSRTPRSRTGSRRWTTRCVVSNGCSLADPLLGKERLALVASYTALRDALDRGRISH
jgi:hypothetical protein